MNKLSYGNYSSSISDFAFDETNGYNDPTSPTETRKQLSFPLKEVKDFVNNTVSVKGSEAVQLVVTNDNTLQYKTSPDAEPVDVTVSGMLNGVILTQAEYDALADKQSILYFAYPE